MQENRDSSDISSTSESITSSTNPRMAELDDVLFGVSTRHQWHALITQIQASTATQNGRNGKKKEKKNRDVIKRNDNDETKEQNKKGGKGQVRIPYTIPWFC